MRRKGRSSSCKCNCCSLERVALCSSYDRLGNLLLGLRKIIKSIWPKYKSRSENIK
jgi:hypothetical protein